MPASGPREADLRELDELIVQTAPELKRQPFVKPGTSMIAYGEMTCQSLSASGV